MMKEGFDLHHLDGDRNNDSPDNIVLIEHRDHMSLHDLKMDGAKLRKFPIVFRREPTAEELRIEEFAYNKGAELAPTGTGAWAVVAVAMRNEFRNDYNNQQACHIARRWAKRNSLPWPLLYGRTSGRASAA